MWKKLNSLKPVRPLVWICDIPWHELDVNDELTNRTTTDFSIFLETRLRRSIYQWEHMRADTVIEPTLPCYLIIYDGGFGITINKRTAKIDKKSDTISQDYIPQIKNEDDIDNKSYKLGFNDGFDCGRTKFPKRVKSFEWSEYERKPIAFEWHNFDTGHSYVDYIPHVNKDEKDGYKKRPLYN